MGPQAELPGMEVPRESTELWGGTHTLLGASPRPVWVSGLFFVGVRIWKMPLFIGGVPLAALEGSPNL